MSKTEAQQILQNSLVTPDGTVLTSNNRHDYVTHQDKNGKQYMVDGGRDYLRRSANGDERDNSIYLTGDHECNRIAFSWGTRGRGGNQPLEYKLLADLDTDHIQAILETQHQAADYVKNLMRAELEYRAAHSIT